MRIISYYCDGGNVAINCGGSIIRISNNYGDCRSRIYIMESEREFKEYTFDNHEPVFYGLWHLENAILLDYDYPDKDTPCKTGVILNGDYYIYIGDSGKVFFVKVA